MKSVSFSITRVNRLRRAAVRARTFLAERRDRWPVESPSNGWFAYADANDLISVFDTLWLKAGFAPPDPHPPRNVVQEAVVEASSGRCRPAGPSARTEQIAVPASDSDCACCRCRSTTQGCSKPRHAGIYGVLDRRREAHGYTSFVQMLLEQLSRGARLGVVVHA